MVKITQPTPKGRRQFSLTTEMPPASAKPRKRASRRRSEKTSEAPAADSAGDTGETS